MPETKEKDQDMRRLLQSLEKREIVLVTTEKTNSSRSTRKRNTKPW